MAKSARKVPKQIGGVKVPKNVRKQADQAIRFTEEHPVIGEAVAGALLAAAAALTGKSTARPDPRAIPTDLVKEAKRAGDIIKDAALTIGRAVLEEAGKFSEPEKVPAPARKAAKASKKAKKGKKPKEKG